MEQRDGDLGVSPAPARRSCCWLPRRPVPRHLATKAPRGMLRLERSNRKAEGASNIRLSSCDIHVFWSSGIYLLIVGFAPICGIHLGKDALMARRSDGIYQRGRLEGLGKDA